ncbi:putative endo/excinuclease amino terminal domain protein [Cotonvirus japonicus]|uniref:Endo/excinuclease amino terminal domain protein n=1 Tax=Cotonvirus japonicus TaxID=2811091 RepID=A0ABM7NT62_9VIRU|nr:putative endo/excinuclease amino terminal domain protein [Cotonvirus japonicus]BCS83291.1 putative endo/excinuclease amino terminal domain protein [Cotonvirus japonicus]
MSDWVCYLIMSLDSNETYIGSTNNRLRRLNNHNNNNPAIKRQGAKRTRGKTWIPIIYVTGFHHKNACLSFESGWKRLVRNRSKERLRYINIMSDSGLEYGPDSKWNRVMDLLYFVHNVTLLDTKFMINYDIRHPVNQPEYLCLDILMEDWIKNLPWPHFIDTQIITFDKK